MTSDDSLTTDAPPEAIHAQTLGKWVAALAQDALAVVEVSQQFAPGAPLRAPLRAGLRHLLHIERLSRGIESLAMLEVCIMLRVTALLANPAEELDSETVLRLRADTPLIEELFPGEKDVIWRFCSALIETERSLPSEQPHAPGPAPAEAVASARAGVTEAAFEATSLEPSQPAAPFEGAALSVDQARAAHSSDAGGGAGAGGESGVDDEAGAVAAEPAPAPMAEPEGVEPESSAASELDGAEPESLAASEPNGVEPVPNGAPSDELVERVCAWAASYRAPTFGGKPYDLTRARAFVRTRVSAWAGQ